MRHAFAPKQIKVQNWHGIYDVNKMDQFSYLSLKTRYTSQIFFIRPATRHLCFTCFVFLSDPLSGKVVWFLSLASNKSINRGCFEINWIFKSYRIHLYVQDTWTQQSSFQLRISASCTLNSSLIHIEKRTVRNNLIRAKHRIDLLFLGLPGESGLWSIQNKKFNS